MDSIKLDILLITFSLQDLQYPSLNTTSSTTWNVKLVFLSPSSLFTIKLELSIYLCSILCSPSSVLCWWNKLISIMSICLRTWDLALTDLNKRPTICKVRSTEEREGAKRRMTRKHETQILLKLRKWLTNKFFLRFLTSRKYIYRYV